MKFFIARIKLINSKNILYIFYKKLYNIFNLFNFKIKYITNSPKFKTLPFHYNYFEKIIYKLKKKNSKIEFIEKDILEIGGGEFWGLMPYFAKNKASSYTNLDPVSDNKLLNSERFIKIFNKKIKNYIDRNNLNKINKDNFVKKIEEISSNKKYDYIVSVSCLEHINDIRSFFKSLNKVIKNSSIQIHIINFSNHLSKNYPFKYIYSENRKQVLKNYNLKINLLRASDFTNILNNMNLDHKFLILDRKKILKNDINEYWHKYNEDTLSIKSAILVIYH